MEPKKSPHILLKNKKRTALVIGAFLLGGTATWLLTKTLDHTWRSVTEPPQRQPYIAVIMSRNGKTFTIPSEFLSGFGNKGSFSSGHNQPIGIRYEDDLLSREQAARVARKLASDPNCVLAIGNSNSELTRVTLDVLLESKTRLPYILPIATATELLEIAKQEHHDAVLRMVPDNENQARVIQRYAATKRVIILVDEENQTYSNGLSKSVADAMIRNGGSILAMKSYGNSSRLIDMLSSLPDDKKADLIIFVGISNNGLVLVDELRNLGITTDVLFTDGCAVEDLIERATDLPGKSLVLSPVTLDERSTKPTYEPIGKDAFDLLVRLFDNIPGSTREDVYAWISKNKDSFIFMGGVAGDYAFAADGNNSKMEFHLYQIADDGTLQLEPGY